MTAPTREQVRRETELSARAAAQKTHRYRTTVERPDPALNGSGVHTHRATCSCGATFCESSTLGGGSAAEAVDRQIGGHVETAASAAASEALAALDRFSA